MLLYNKDEFVKEFMKIKNIKYTEAHDYNKIFENYKASINKIYHAVCLDIDGTIVDNDNIYSSDKVNDELYKLLKKRVPIILITGRGESSLKEFIKKLIFSLQRRHKIVYEDYKRIMGIGNDGQILVYTSPNEKNEVCNKVELIVDIDDIDKLTSIYSKLKNYMSYERVYGVIDIKDSYSRTYSHLMNLRIIVQDKNKEDEIHDKVRGFIDKLEDDYKKILKLSRGYYKGSPVFQIGVSDKGIAVSKVEEFLGIPKDSTIRIGDMGDKNGNDYFMLNCPQGFSVNTCSSNLYGCYPVFNKGYEQVISVDATIQILREVKIYSTLCLEKPNYNKYRNELAQVEREINIGNCEIITRYNKIFNVNFRFSNGFNDFFDMKSGAIKFRDWEWVFIEDDNPLKKLFMKKENHTETNLRGDYFYKYMIPSDTGIILRGPSCYYYFLCFKNKQVGVKKENILEWQQNYTTFLDQVINVLETYKIEDLNDIRMLVGILDNIRNLLLVIINSCIYKNYNENFVISFSTHDDQELKKWYNMGLKTYEYIYDCLFFEDDFELHQSELTKHINYIRNEFEKYIILFVDREKKIFSKSFRTYREIDNFIENYITIELSLEKIEEENIEINRKDIYVYGVNYGGLELPLISKEIFSNKGYRIFPSVVGRHNGEYRKDHAEDTASLHNKIKKFNFYGTHLHNSYNILADDNVLSGKTLQILINLFNESEQEVDDIIIVRYPSINRLEHMFKEKPGAVDISQFFTFIKGVMFKSPYTKVKNRKSYVDEINVFNKARDRIVKYLYKNQLFDDSSEVSKKYKKEVNK